MGKNILDHVIGGVLKAGKIAAVGKGAKYADDGTRMVGGMAGFVDGIDLVQEAYNIGNMAEGVIGVNKGLFKAATKHVDPGNATGVIASLTGRKIKTGVAIGGTVVLGGLSVGSETFKVHNKFSRGENIGVVNLPGVTSELPVNGTEDLKDDSLIENIKRNTLSNYGATGDIVFALNNMR